MSKAILVIDMPESCDQCPLLLRFMEERCCVPEKRNSFTTKPYWCPLKPVPEKYDVGIDYGNYKSVDYEFGYNRCIDEILR